MKQLISICFALFCSGVTGHTQFINPEWQQFTNGSSLTYNSRSLPHPAGGVYVVRSNNYDVNCLHINSAGIVQWANSFNHGQLEDINDLETDASGNLYLLIRTAPLSPINLGEDIIVRKYSPTGVVLYSTIINHIDEPLSNEERDFPVEMVVGSAGEVYVSATHIHVIACTAFMYAMVYKLNTAGVRDWTYRIQTGRAETGSIVFDGSGNLVFSYMDGTSANPLPCVRKLDPATGNSLQFAAITYPGTYDILHPFRLKTDAQGTVYGATEYYYSYLQGWHNMLLVQFGSNCQPVWSDTLVGMNNTISEEVVDFNFGLNNTVFVLGFIPSYSYGSLYHVDGSGQVLSQQLIIGNNNSYLTPKSLAVDNNGQILIASSESNSSNSEMVLRAFSPTGSPLWNSQPYSCSLYNVPDGTITCNALGEIYCNGNSGPIMNGGPRNFYTVKYNGLTTNDVELSSGITGMQVWPNPADNELHIAAPVTGKASQLIIYNQLGQKIITQPVSGNSKVVISVAHLEPGLYYMQLQENGSAVQRTMFVKN